MVQPVDDRPQKPAWLRIVIALAAILFLGKAILVLTGGSGDEGPPKDDGVSALVFDGPRWRASRTPAPTAPGDASVFRPTRLRMVEDLLQSDRLDDATMNEVARLLGTPDATRPEGEGESAPLFGPAWGPRVSQRWFFRLGPKRNAPGPTEALEWLILDFEQDGHIVSRTLFAK